MNIPITETGKRIQNYVFNYSDFLGAGNFSKCYKGYNELTSTSSVIVSRRSRRHQDRRTQLAQVQKTLVTALPRDRDPQKTKPPQRPQMFRNLHFQSQLLHHH